MVSCGGQGGFFMGKSHVVTMNPGGKSGAKATALMSSPDAGAIAGEPLISRSVWRRVYRRFLAEGDVLSIPGKWELK
jgi:hypothetical protein